MILPSAIQKFLGRQLSDCRPYKEMDQDRLQSICDRLPVVPPIWKRLKLHQKASFLLGAQTGGFAYFLDCGMGKTMLSLALIRYFEKINKVRRTLVLVPNLINKDEWADQMEQHCPGMHYCILRGSSKHKWEQLAKTQAPVVVETYPGLLNMVCDRVKTRKGNRFKPNRRKMQGLYARFDGLVLDESTAVKGVRKLPFRICRQLAKRSNMTFALTGTPFGSDPSDLWAQLFLVDGGQTLGPTLGLFRAAFFQEKVKPWGGIEYSFIKNKRKLLSQMLANRSIRYRADDGDLPTLVSINKRVKLPKDIFSYVDQAKKAMREARGNYQETRNVFMRMRQLSSGWLGYSDDESGARAQYEFKPNPKLDMLLALLQAIDPRYKVIVFNEFIFSGAMICRELKRVGIPHVRVYGGTKDPAASIQAFKTDPDIRVLVLNNTQSFGSNLQIAKFGVFFETPVSPLMRKQCVSRFERQHSQHGKVFQYDLITLGTFDEKILTALAAGQDFLQQVLGDKK